MVHHSLFIDCPKNEMVAVAVDQTWAMNENYCGKRKMVIRQQTLLETNEN